MSFPALPADEGPAPVTHPDNAPWWQALQEGEFCLPRCTACGTIRFPPTPCCWRCLSFDYELAVLPAAGTVAVTVTVERSTGRSSWHRGIPYRVGLVEVGGLRLPGRVLCSCGEADTPGTAVSAVRIPAEAGAAVYAFAHRCCG